MRSPPAWAADNRPQLATLTKAATAGEGRLHEIEFDGYCMMGHIARGHARLIGRNGLTWTTKLPEIAGAVHDRLSQYQL